MIIIPKVLHDLKGLENLYKLLYRIIKGNINISFLHKHIKVLHDLKGLENLYKLLYRIIKGNINISLQLVQID